MHWTAVVTALKLVFQDQVHDVAERMSDARSRDSTVPCPACGSTSAPFPDAVVILHVPPSTWDGLVAARASLTRTLVDVLELFRACICRLHFDNVRRH